MDPLMLILFVLLPIAPVLLFPARVMGRGDRTDWGRCRGGSAEGQSDEASNKNCWKILSRRRIQGEGQPMDPASETEAPAPSGAQICASVYQSVP